MARWVRKFFSTLTPGRSGCQTSELMGLQRQIARHGNSLSGMPPVLVYRGSDGELMLSDGVTRATRAAKLCPGSVIPAELLGTLARPFGHLPTVKEKLP